MADSLTFPLYFFRAASSRAVVFMVRDDQNHLPLFTSAENANRYRKFGTLDVQIGRLRDASELRNLLLDCRQESGDFKIAIDPMFEDACTMRCS